MRRIKVKETRQPEASPLPVEARQVRDGVGWDIRRMPCSTAARQQSTPHSGATRSAAIRQCVNAQTLILAVVKLHQRFELIATP